MQIGILLHVKTAPETSALVLELAQKEEECVACKFYRNEAVPKVIVISRGGGPV